VNLAVGTADAGTLTGTFTLSDDLTALEAVDITSSQATVGAYTFAETRYTLSPGTTAYIDQLPNYFRLSIFPTNELRLDFVGGLGASGTFQIGGTSYENYYLAGNRTVASGTVTAGSGAVPEPSSIAMAAVAAGAGIVASARSRRRREAVEAS
jgi:hypothetical protein